MTPSHPRLINIVASRVIPFVILLYVCACAVVFNTLRLMAWRVRYRDQAGALIVPCFDLTGPSGGSSVVRVLSTIGSGLGAVGFLIAAVAWGRASLGGSYLRYLAWYARRNYGLTFWVLFSFVMVLVVQGATEINITARTFLIIPILSGLDFLLLLMQESDRGAILLYRSFYILNTLALVINYVANVAALNQCRGGEAELHGPSRPATMFWVVAGALNDIGRAGFLIAVCKVQFNKILRPGAPGLGYGLASHLYLTETVPGSPSVLLLGTGDLALFSLVRWDVRITTAITLPFTFPGSHFSRVMSVYAVLPTAWVLLAMADNVMDALGLRLVPEGRCWVTKPALAFQPRIKLAGLFSAILVVVAITSVLRAYRLLWVAFVWTLYWLRRNWLFTILCLARSVNDFRPLVPMSTAIFTLVRYSVLLPFSLAVPDLVTLLCPGSLFKYSQLIFILQQVTAQVIFYCVGQARENKCGEVYEEGGSYFHTKVQNLVLLFFSLQYLSFLSIKIFSGSTTAPLLKLSLKNRFARGSALPRARIEEMVEVVSL
jgi:hypothetical protein